MKQAFIMWLVWLLPTLWGASLVFGQTPAPTPAPQRELVCDWMIANSGLEFGSIRWVTREGGWPKFIAEYVRPAVAWCKASNVKPIILIHHPFGLYAEVVKGPDNSVWEAFHIDGYDYAKAAKATWLINDFATDKGWKDITDEADCYVYVGGVDITPRLRNLPPAELAKTIERNLKPMKDAGFKGVYVDAAENAITHYFKGVNANQTVGRSLDTITLELADKMFPHKTGVEAAPRSSREFAPLWSRNLIAQDDVWQHRYGPIGRNPNYAVLSYDASVLKGKIWRRLHYSEDVPDVLKNARAIVAQGHTPAISVSPLIKAGVKASAVFETGTP